MPPVRDQVLLAGLTTLGVGGPARRFVRASTDAELIAAVRAADQRGEPLLILAGGSNLVIADAGFPGTVVQIATRGIEQEPDGAEAVRLTVAAGEDWDGVVAYCVHAGLAGLECLSGIPGRTGATPIQNVGAYGQEVAEVITAVRVYDRLTGEVTELAGADCGFGYRTSMFKRDSSGRRVVLGVTFRLLPSALSAPIRYAELARALGVPEGDRAPLSAVRSAVLTLRRGKGMVLDPADPDSRSAGSFFTNPVLDDAQFAALQKIVAERSGGDLPIPQFPAGPGQVKVPAAWLIGQAGFAKGHPGTRGARISTKHTLALVNPGGATAADIAGLAREIRDQVRDELGVDLACEPVLVGLTL
ncbi:MAG TPA: UDP-N-acetylmuramate dehydrogenase [Streptosporangiaceae bacterium]